MQRVLILGLAMIMLSSCTESSSPPNTESEVASTTPIESFSLTCSYSNTKTSQSYTGQCLQTWFEGGRNEIVGGGFTFKFPSDTKRQGQWTKTTWNGKLAIRYEINRDKYAYATLDLTEFLDVE